MQWMGDGKLPLERQNQMELRGWAVHASKRQG
jgi:hypothetical protein